MESHFFSYLYRLRYIDRWSLMRNTHKESVAVHSYYVAALAHLLCTIANEAFGKAVPTDRVVSMALFHDATEVFVGDVAAPVKASNPDVRRSFREIEKAAADSIVRMIPEPLRDVYEPLVHGHDDALYVWVKAADLLDAYLKALSELTAGNREFAVAKAQLEASLKKLNMPEVDYFLTTMAPSFEKTLDEIVGTEP
ncbi:5'-deoxynucleotidase [Paenibacillus antri]|uniref:5'-deoxynucleotidase n=1 Tax=Paenibacillus antri TaxID=2582848 RepID=A0A5R9GAB9_9BACL|nr:5'-deoxynucleotidase [Paenibacillus antri]TLS51030.1 5'-deoxynucleotidase [Paenibacillus antri]